MFGKFGNASLVVVLLLSLRLAAAFGLTPLLSGVPPMVRTWLVIGLAICLALGLSQVSLSATELARLSAEAAMAEAAVRELALGMTLALGILLAFAVFSMAGQMLSLQVGFGLGQAIDPISNKQAPVLTSVFDQLAVVVFFLGNGHHALLRGIAYSLERFPLGAPWPLEAGLEPIVLQLAGFFSLGFALAAPVVFSLLMLEVALGVLARNLPQVNMFAIGVPTKVVVGLAALSLWLGGLGDVMDRVYASLYRCWDAIFAVAGADDPRLATGLASLVFPRSGVSSGML